MVAIHLLLAAALTQTRFHVAARTVPLAGDISLLDRTTSIVHARSEPVILQPLRNIRRGNTKRDRRAALGLKSEETFYWQGNDGTVAKFDLKAPGANENIVNLEQIDNLVQKVTCPESDAGELKLEFADAADFDDAQDIWDWVNQEEDNSFLMVVGEGDCGLNAERILYNVTGLVYNDEKETAVLQVKETTWKTAAHTFDLTVGKQALPPTVSESKRRRSLGDLIDKAKDKVADTVEKVTDKISDTVDKVKDKTSDLIEEIPSKVDKFINETETIIGKAKEKIESGLDKAKPIASSILSPSLTPEFTIPFNASGLTGKTLTLSGASGLDTIVTCVECSTSGSISISARFSAELFELKEANIDLTLDEDLTATAILTMGLRGDLTSGLAVSKSVPIFEFSPAGIVIPGVMTIGPTVGINLGAEINEIKGAISMTLGGTAKLPKGSSARLDFLNEDKLTKEGWDLEFDEAPFKADASVTASAGLFLRGTVGMEVSVVGELSFPARGQGLTTKNENGIDFGIRKRILSRADGKPAEFGGELKGCYVYFFFFFFFAFRKHQPPRRLLTFYHFSCNLLCLRQFSERA